MIDFNVIIPARYASTRLPGKPLLDIEGKPMILHVVDRAKQSGAKNVIVATDHPQIFETVRKAQVDVCLTDANHPSGTDRLAEVVQLKHYTDDQIVVNVQGDEPLISPALIYQVAEALAQHPDAVCATAAHPIYMQDEIENPNTVKVVLNQKGYGLYFSRAPIPFKRDPHTQPHLHRAYRHIGLYAYRVGFLKRYQQLPPAPIEQLEALEQLRILWNDEKIFVTISQHPPAPGVDTIDDLKLVHRLLRKTQNKTEI